MFKGRSGLINQVSLLAFLALCVVAALGWLDIKDRYSIEKILQTQDQLIKAKEHLSKIERRLLSSRIDEISMIQTRRYEMFQSFQKNIHQLEVLSADLIKDIESSSDFPPGFLDNLKITLTQDLGAYERSVQTAAIIEIKIGLGEGQGLLNDIEIVRDDIMRLIEASGEDNLKLEFSNIQLSERAFAETLDMGISEQLVLDVANFETAIQDIPLSSDIQRALLECQEKYHYLVIELIASTVERELATAASSLHFQRITPELDNSQTSLNESLSLLEAALVRQRQVSILQTGFLFGGAFLIIAVFTCLQIRRNQQLVNRLKQLANHMTEVALGYYPKSKDLPQGTDEVGTLSEAFLSMTAQIHEQINTIESERKKAEIASQAKSIFLANMSHELRTPLNAILGFAQVMQQSPSLDEECCRYISIINNSGEHLLALINEVLEISKIESGKFSLNLTQFDLDHLLNLIQALFQDRAHRKQLQLRVVRSPEVPRYIYTDEAKLRQILINLLGNALKFTGTGGVFLTVKLDSLSAKPSPPTASHPQRSLQENSLKAVHTVPDQPFLAKLLFIVEDTGPGISSGELGHIFEAFAQTKVGQQAQQGSGLGLAISRQFAQLMGGDLTVSSVQGKGSTFTLALEVDCSVNAHDGPAGALPDLPGRIYKLAAGQGPRRILVAEDQPTNRLLMRKLLEAVGFEVKEADNGQTAIELWQSWQPDLILMDIRMPKMNGTEAIELIRQRQSRLQPKIIALTASAMDEQRQAILEAGCDDFASKPVNREQLLKLIGHHLQVSYQYDHAAQAQASAEQPSPSATQGLRRMSDQWIQQLHRAAIRGDDCSIHQLISQIPDEQQELIKILKTWTDNYQFDRLVEMVEPAKP